MVRVLRLATFYREETSGVAAAWRPRRGSPCAGLAIEDQTKVTTPCAPTCTRD